MPAEMNKPRIIHDSVELTGTKQLTISAIIPTFRREEHLVKTIECLVNQTRKPDEILVLDQTPLGEHRPETIQFLRKSDKRGDIRLILLATPSVYKARNRAIELAKSDILLYLDDDITPMPDFVEKHLRHYDNPRIDAIAGSILRSSEDSLVGIPEHFRKQPYWKQAFTRLNKFDEPVQQMCGMAACNFSIRKETLLRVFGWDEHILNYGDRDLGIRLYEAGYRVDYDPEAMIIHHHALRGGTRASDKSNPLKPWERCVSLHYLSLRHLKGWAYIRYGLLRAARFSFLLRRNFLRPHRWPIEFYGYLKAYQTARAWAREGMKSPFITGKKQQDACIETGGTPPVLIPGTTPLVIVAQLGARHRYAVPVILKRAGLLQQLYTDNYAGKGMMKALVGLAAKFSSSEFVKSFAGRTADLSPGDVTAFQRLGLEYWRKLRKASTPGESTFTKLDIGSRFGRKVAARAGNPAAVYGFNSAAAELFRRCKSSGTICILDQTMAAREQHEEIMENERTRWKGWETTQPDSHIQNFIQREFEEWHLSDLILCPSRFVLESIASCGADPSKCCVVPYGVQTSEFAVKHPAVSPPDATLRVLFVGSVGLRKGIPYLLEAARLLGKKAEFRIIGPIHCDKDKLEQMIPPNTSLLGKVPHAELGSHYRWADVFCLPSLFEGSATVTYEALASGLPVICTANSGSVVRDDQDGFVVPVRNGVAIAEKLQRLAGDRELLVSMSESAAKRAAEFTWEEYGKRLLKAIKGVMIQGGVEPQEVQAEKKLEEVML